MAAMSGIDDHSLEPYAPILGKNGTGVHQEQKKGQQEETLSLLRFIWPPWHITCLFFIFLPFN
jgi:hypothetical protein